MAGSPPNLSAYIQGVLKVKVKVKGHVIRALSWILEMSYSVIDGLVISCQVSGLPWIWISMDISMDIMLAHLLIKLTTLYALSLTL